MWTLHRLCYILLFIKLCVGDASSYANSEASIAKSGLLANIGTNGAKSGIVIASPSNSNPNYLYTWIRDGALVLKVLIDEYTQGRDNTLLSRVTDYVSASQVLQGIPNRSGGVGEPKFQINETAFNGDWGRPQNDGPALRATAMITFANYLISQGNKTYPANTIWPIVKTDLDYVAKAWNTTGFDLWEEVEGSSFFTTAVQHRALREGAAFASAQGDSSRSSTYSTQAANVLCFLQSYWSSSSAALIANTNMNNGRSGLDINTILGSIHTFDPSAGPDPITFQPGSDRALLNHYTTVNSFRGSLYSLNANIPAGQAVNIGRYKEDVYYNGNPWYLATLAAGEQLYLALYQWKAAGGITVTSTSLPFYRQLWSGVQTQTYSASSSGYSTIVSAVSKYADGFLALSQKYTPSDGQLSEQYLKTSGTPTSAVKLTWSFAAALTAFDAKNGSVPASWGAKGLSVSCTTVKVTFNEYATTIYGENIFLVGSVPALGSWNADNAIPLSSTNYPTWSATVGLAPGVAVQYKFIRKLNGQVTWESDPNRQVTAPSSGSYTENDSWR